VLFHILTTRSVTQKFAVVGPRVWNSLLAYLHDEDFIYRTFRCELKMHWF